MQNSHRNVNNEQQKLINDNVASYNNNNNQRQHHSSRLEWAEASWTRWLHVLCYWWISPILSIGYNRPLTENDLDVLSDKYKASVLLRRLQSYDWTITTTWKIIIREFWKDYIFVSLLCVPFLCSRIVQPLLLRQVVLTAMNPDASLFTIYIFVILMCLCGIVQVLLDQQTQFLSFCVAIKISNALTSAIYDHLLCIKSTVWQQMNIGKFFNLIADDPRKFYEMYVRLHMLIEGPVEFIIVVGFLCWIIGPIPALCSFLILCLSQIVLLLVSRYNEKYREAKVSCGDKRIHAFNEFINGCYMIKMYNWQKSMEDRINQLRHEETAVLQHAYIVRTINTIYSFTLLPLLTLTIFSTAWLLDYPLNAVDCFTTVAFLTLIRSQIMFIMPLITDKITDAQVASERIDSVMRLVTMQDRRTSSPPTTTTLVHDLKKGKISMVDASFSWHEDHCCLSSLNITIEPGIFVGIVGAVGSGKSSLLAAILDEMNLINGTFHTSNSSFSYAAQSPWIFADTARNNILLNQLFDEQRYRDVIYACCLDVDFSLFGTSGDLTMIGEKGVNLSGGQKARVSLARALYNDADIYLIDDPLAAVDGTVAKQIYERCFSSRGLLKNKTRLLVTHQTEFLKEAHQIIFLSHGHIDEQGRLDETIISKHNTDKNKSSKLSNMLDENLSIPDAQPIVTEETGVSGKVNWTVWFRLFSAPPLGILGFCLLIILLVLAEVFYDGSNYWLRIWVKRSFADQQRRPIFAYIYFGLTIATILADIVCSCYYFSVLVNGSNYLHDNMVKALLNTSMQFFESNPSGRILSRASKDQIIVDDRLPQNVLNPVKLSLSSIGSIVIICIIQPYIILVVVALVPFCVLMCRFYLRSKKHFKRLESITSSPMYDLVSSSLSGLATIRAFKVEDHFIELFNDRIDRYTRVFLNMQGSIRWFSIQLSLLSFITTVVTAILLVFLRNEIDPSSIALSLTYAISIPKLFQVAIQLLFDAETLMTSAERIHEYVQLPAEEDYGGHQRLVKTTPEWPSHGTIQFRNYSLRHRSAQESVLKNITVRIESGEKIGIIGRTGAGKSSLFKGLFRFIDRSNIDGEILIDDVDISRITLDHLRSHLSIIPQQPILLSGTLRYNLDPFNIYSDEQCWMALEDVQLKQFVSNHSADLQMVIAESGSNLSAGQSQLICIARAILKKSKILLIDEATSNVDKKTDEIIQNVMTNKFQDRTVLTIAHRLNTVAKSDRILVLDEGVIVNFDTPMNILQYYQ